MTASNIESPFEFIWKVRVYYEDTDSGGVVYYANYLKFMERARTEYLRSWGFEQNSLRDEAGIIFAVSELNISYDKPAVFNDEIEVKSRIIKLGKASILFNQDIIRSDDETRLCTAQVKIACLNEKKFSAQAMPVTIYNKIKTELIT